MKWRKVEEAKKARAKVCGGGAGGAGGGGGRPTAAVTTAEKPARATAGQKRILDRKCGLRAVAAPSTQAQVNQGPKCVWNNAGETSISSSQKPVGS
jgi:hypothetical protein